LVKPSIIVVITIAGILSLFPNINLYEFRGEESLRMIVAFEMKSSGNYTQPTFLGDLYFNKPPLFNWFIVGSSFIIPWSELTGRAVSIFFLILTLLLIYLFTYSLYQNRTLALISSLVYLTFVDVLFWYGYLAEIDITLAFFIFLMFVSLYRGYFYNNNLLIILSGVITGFAFLLKGFPAFVFFGLTALSFILFKKQPKDIFLPAFWLGGILAIVIPSFWIINTAEPEIYIRKLIIESLVRTKGGKDIVKFLTHLISYPLLNLKQMLFTSATVLFLIFYAKKNRIPIQLPPEIRLFLLTVFINYLPYLLAVNSRGRYVIPLFPIMAIVFSYLIFNIGKERWVRFTVYTAVFAVALRFAVGLVGFPILMEKKASRKRVAYQIAGIVDLDKKIACDCKREKTVCLYIDFMKGKPLKTSRHIPDWDYLIDCSDRKIDGSVVGSFNLKKRVIKLYERNR